MKRARNDQVIVGAELVEAAFLERPVEDQASSLVDDHESKDSPAVCEHVFLHESLGGREMGSPYMVMGKRTDGG